MLFAKMIDRLAEWQVDGGGKEKEEQLHKMWQKNIYSSSVWFTVHDVSLVFNNRWIFTVIY